ncbi:MAG: DUF302 domain-containing protein [Bradyrhizobium sp.]|uniref:DUF302 domain-containing protein n=1 Tax=Bradyrhizobium sp. TaxID=376 RepID=UPI00271F06E8|nr:DUF302 domain-containing protein [Bradyrhizobium sp.]MDO9561573.1 DUF302 domain-containing protein [Bradyrhizobium sp.]MDP3694427.1 DUF302 domain-containing protein [Bradyrhizobium sp.]
MFRLALSIAVLFIALSAASAGTVKTRAGWIVIDTRQSYQALVERLEATVKSEKMGIVTSASASDGAKAAGFTIPGNKVFGVFRNDFARRMLGSSLTAGIEAPIRIYVTENPDGTATLSYKKPSTVFAPYADEGGDVLRSIGEELDGIFSRIAERATADK